MASNDERPGPTRIGAGSFATAFVICGGPAVFKEVAQADDGPTLRREYHLLQAIHRHCSDLFFAVPRAFAFNDPFATPDGFLTDYLPGPRTRNIRPVVTPGVMAAFARPTYAMDRVYALPYDAGNVLSSLFFPPSIKERPALCRLYFGKDLSQTTSRFINTQNFPLDVRRYDQLREVFPEFLFEGSEVASGMGEMLSQLHYKLSVDARDVEFILGGAGIAGFSYFMIDFNQVRTWTKGADTIPALVSAFFDNDPYYPRPRPGDTLYGHFKKAYMAACPDEDQSIAGTFLKTIEKEQARRDSCSSLLG